MRAAAQYPKRVNFAIDEPLLEAFKARCVDDGVTQMEGNRRAMQMWVERGDIVVDPDDHLCRRCHHPVRYALVRANQSASFERVKGETGGAYHLKEVTLEGEHTGEFRAVYVPMADRDGSEEWRQHDCPAKRVKP